MNGTERQALKVQIQHAFDHARDRMIDALADAPDAEMFRSVELELRDAARDLAAKVHQAGLQARKKGATKAPPSSVPTATLTPVSSTIDHDRS